MERVLRPGDFYRRLNGGLYQILTVAEHAQTGEKLVVYQALHGDFRVYAMPADCFLGREGSEGSSAAEQAYCFVPALPREDISAPKSGVGEAAPAQASPRDGAASAQPSFRDGGEADSLNPLVVPFLEEEDFGGKLAVFAVLRKTVTQKDLDVLYDALDLPAKGGTVREQADSIEAYLKMQQKYSGTRLR